MRPPSAEIRSIIALMPGWPDSSQLLGRECRALDQVAGIYPPCALVPTFHGWRLQQRLPHEGHLVIAFRSSYGRAS